MGSFCAGIWVIENHLPVRMRITALLREQPKALPNSPGSVIFITKLLAYCLDLQIYYFDYLFLFLAQYDRMRLDTAFFSSGVILRRFFLETDLTDELLF